MASKQEQNKPSIIRTKPETKPRGCRQVEEQPNKTIHYQYKPTTEEKELYQTAVARIATSNQLPLVVEVTKSSSVPADLSLQANDVLMLHCIRKVKRVYATDNEGTDIYLPLQAEQLYEILPIDPVHDDKEYEGTQALTNARPLPQRVRITEAQSMEHPLQSQGVGDVIEVECVRTEVNPQEGGREKTVIGTWHGNPIAFPASMNFASYSTMPSPNLHTMLEVVEMFKPPLRIRKASKRSYVLKLHAVREEPQVIATKVSTVNNTLFSIPLSCTVPLKVVTGVDSQVFTQGPLKPLYPYLHTDWNMLELGRIQLSREFQQIMQPMEVIMKEWSISKEGKIHARNICNEAADEDKKYRESLLEDVGRLERELKLYRDHQPSVPPRKGTAAPAPPLLPPKPAALRFSSFGIKEEDTLDSNDYEIPDDDYEYPDDLIKTRNTAIRLVDLKKINDRLLKENKVLTKRNTEYTYTICRLQQEIDNFNKDPTYYSLTMIEGNSIYQT